MKAIQIREFNAVSDLIPKEVKTPEPKPGEVLVKVSYAAINPSDLKNFQGSMTHTRLPRVIGRDFAGEIVKGPAERIGEKVWGTGGDLGFERDGTHAEYVAVPGDAAVTLPKGFDPAQAATLGVPFVTAMSAICRRRTSRGPLSPFCRGSGPAFASFDGVHFGTLLNLPLTC